MGQVRSPEPVSSMLMEEELLGAQLKATQGSYPTWLWTVVWWSSMLTTDLLQKQGVLTMFLISMRLSNMLLRTQKILVLTLLVLPLLGRVVVDTYVQLPWFTWPGWRSPTW